MPDSRKHRGKHPSDQDEFSLVNKLMLKEAFSDLVYLLNRNYSINAILELVGNRYKLSKRQRLSLLRSSCSDEDKNFRFKKLIKTIEIQAEAVWIDGFNLLITLETMLSGGIVLKGPDTCLRDLSGIHGSYRKVSETDKAIDLVIDAFKKYNLNKAFWLFDSPVSNSGRLAAMVRDKAREHNLEWTVELVFNPDKQLALAPGPVVTSDSWILDNSNTWINLVEEIVKINNLEIDLVDFS